MYEAGHGVLVNLSAVTHVVFGDQIVWQASGLRGAYGPGVRYYFSYRLNQDISVSRDQLEDYMSRLRVQINRCMGLK